MNSAEASKYIDATFLKWTEPSSALVNFLKSIVDYPFACVVVPPFAVRHTKKFLLDRGSRIPVCTVIDFPLGFQERKMKIALTRSAIESGAGEVDCVSNLSLYRTNPVGYAEEIAECVQEAKRQGVLVKIIMETPLMTEEEWLKAGEIILSSGADFVKTATGFFGPTRLETVQAIRKIPQAEGKIKVAGGIRTSEQFLQMLKAGATRIGTSTPLDILSSLAV